jgi:hypothetical protein
LRTCAARDMRNFELIIIATRRRDRRVFGHTCTLALVAGWALKSSLPLT